ncbi:LPXTG-motif cell wall anchor domain-containing protein [Listeria weihenstephanensis FSL R9-0317]|uniref:SpaA isopeptide-forming pilin-related protein n=1 Tax=Listeria weihenstephanensis TaxID=1006155 RepID=UPI0003E84D20|nr:SpaA isopeptide-forming pilin-related protein [Listeria weihenstephanensis]EUJ40626.1 LPXTG-motif cell wall anchor domain-containing protein [Listeria weihenstephanensis FSL R9-0317]
MNQMNINKMKVIGSLLVLCISLLLPSIQVFAEELNLDTKTGYNYTGINPDGKTITDINLERMKLDGFDVFCIEHGKYATDGDVYQSATYNGSHKELLSKIAYFGFTNTDQTNYDYAVAQLMIWETLGDQYQSSTIPNYAQRKGEIMKLINRYNTDPSFANKTYTVNVGETLVIEDSHTVLSDMQLASIPKNLKVEKDGNKLKITATSDSQSGVVSLQKVANNKIGTSIVYTKPDRQALAKFQLEDKGEASFSVDVRHRGDLEVMKIDEDTKKPLANAKIKFQYGSTTKDVVTGKDGMAKIEGILEGTEVTVSEVTAPNGYVNKGELLKAVIKPNSCVTLTLNNKEQLGTVNIVKTGEEFGATMPNSFYSLENATFGVFTDKDVRVGTIKTDLKGHGALSDLKLGNYYLLEEMAPNGFKISTEKISFVLAYAGQNVEVASTSVAITNEEQKGIAVLIKEDSGTGAIPQGAATLDGAVYELHRASNDELVDTVIIEAGRAQVENLILDDYYWLEKQAPIGYQLDTKKHAFTIAYAGEKVETAIQETVVKEDIILGSFDIIKFGNYDWKNSLIQYLKGENPAILPLENVEFTVISRTTNAVVQVGITNVEGYVSFKDLPYDTYTVKETTTPEGYKVSNDFDVTISEHGQTHHYAVENKVIEERIKVVKYDLATGETIPRTGAGFQIRNVGTGELVQLPNVDSDGLTDTFYTNSEGFLQLSKALGYGNYELSEVQAPEGYMLSAEKVSFTVDGSHGGLIVIRFGDQAIPKITENLVETGQPLFSHIAMGATLTLASLLTIWRVRKA